MVGSCPRPIRCDPSSKRRVLWGFRRAAPPARSMPLSPLLEGTVSHFSREPKVVSHFSRGPKPPRHPSGGPGVVTARASVAHTTVTPANGEESPSARRFGEILVEEKFITVAQLEAALRLQT